MKSKLILMFLIGLILISCNDDDIDIVNPVRAVSLVDLADPSEEIKPKIIKIADIEINSDEIKSDANEVISMFEGISGELIYDKEYNDEYNSKREIEIKVPAENFEKFISDISNKFVDNITEKNISTKDVTEEYIDIEVRLKTKYKLENKYKELLKKANTVEEILKIEKELGNLREDIESIEGRKKYLDSKISMSRIYIKIVQNKREESRYRTKVVQSLVDGYDLLLNFILGLLQFWFFIILSIVLIIWFKRRKRKKMNNQ